MRRPLELAVGPVLLSIGAFLLGSLALFAIAVGLAITYVGLHVAVSQAADRVRLTRRLGHHEIVEGSTLSVEIDVDGLRGLPVSIELLCQCGRWHSAHHGTNHAEWRLDRPGPHAVGPTPLRIKDDLGLFNRVVVAGEPEELLVLPVPASVAPGPRLGMVEASPDQEPDGLRTYVPGTPVSRIHWKSAARGADLQERAFAPAADHLPLVLVDTTAPASEAALDWTARTAAGHVLTLARGGGCRVLLPGDRTPVVLRDPVAHWPAVHRRLADLATGRHAARLGPADQAGAVHVSAAAAPLIDRETQPATLPPNVTRVGAWAQR